MEDLIREILRQLGTDRAQVIGPADISRNALLRVISRLAVCYGPPPLVTGLDPTLADLVGDWSGSRAREEYGRRTEGGLPLPSRLCRALAYLQRIWLAENEAGLAVTWGRDRPVLRAITSDLLRGEEDSEDPGQPVLLGWQRRRLLDGQTWTTTWDTWDVRDPDAPSFRILAGDWPDGGDPPAEDVTGRALGHGALTGDDYSWRWTREARAGRPFVPIRLYHRQPIGGLFDRDSGAELAQGTLTVAVLWSYWRHIVQDCSWPQRWVENVEVEGIAATEADGPAGIPTDPATVLRFLRSDPATPAQIGQWEAGGDPEVIGRAILAYEQALEGQMVPVDYSATGGDPLARLEAARLQAIQQMYPTCREHDGAVLEIMAAVANRALGTAYPESGYGLLYRDEIPTAPSSEERSSETDGSSEETAPRT
jgi:hypothetical protein